MAPPTMHLELLLPHRVFEDRADVTRIVAESASGSFGVLPQRLDCVAALVPGILFYETAARGQVYVAIDEGVLVKAGVDVRISVRRALVGPELPELRSKVEREFRAVDAQERSLRQVMTKLETGLLRRFMDLKHAQR